MAESKRSERWRAGWLLGSLLLHGLLLTFAATRPPREARGVAPSVRPQELEIEVLAEAPEVAATEAQAHADAQAAEPARVARAGGAARGVAAPTDAAGSTSEELASEAPGEAASPPSSVPTVAAPHLNLAALGVDGANPFLDRGDPATQRAAKAARVKRRLDDALAQGIASQDTERGRGAGGPVLRSLEAAVYASALPLNGSASLVLVIDSEGKLVSTSLGDVSSDREGWSRVARQTARALAQRKLSVPKGRSVRLTVAVSSHLELPSGADPGVEVRAFGLPLKKGDGPRSTRLDILNPLNPLAPLSLAGDPADIGARARRMVHAHVVSEELM